jgi:iron-sulfur cluster repair protein YtfE (RIC family)
VTYQTRQDLLTYHDQVLDQKIAEYLANTDDPLLIGTQLQELMNYNIKHRLLTFSTFVKVLEKVIQDYDTYLRHTSPELDQTVNELRRVVEVVHQFQNRLINQEVQIAFNLAFVRQKKDFPILKLNLYNNRGIGNTND